MLMLNDLIGYINYIIILTDDLTLSKRSLIERYHTDNQCENNDIICSNDLTMNDVLSSDSHIQFKICSHIQVF